MMDIRCEVVVDGTKCTSVYPVPTYIWRTADEVTRDHFRHQAEVMLVEEIVRNLDIRRTETDTSKAF